MLSVLVNGEDKCKRSTRAHYIVWIVALKVLTPSQKVVDVKRRNFWTVVEATHTFTSSTLGTICFPLTWSSRWLVTQTHLGEACEIVWEKKTEAWQVIGWTICHELNTVPLPLYKDGWSLCDDTPICFMEGFEAWRGVSVRLRPSPST